MQKIIQSQTHSKSQDMQRDYYLNQKKALEINPRHPLIKELLRRVEDNPADASAKDMAIMMFNTATLRYIIQCPTLPANIPALTCHHIIAGCVLLSCSTWLLNI